MRKVLVLRGGALGDFIVTLPALAALRARWPEARIELAGNATAAQLAVARGVITAAHSQHGARWGALFATAPLPEDFAAWLASFDLVVSWWPDPGGDLRRHFPVHAGQIFLAGEAHPRTAPAAAHYGATLGALGLGAPAPFHRLQTGATARHGTIVHPGSGSPRKNWPRERWLALLPELPAPVMVVLGEAELAGAPWPELDGVTVLQRPSLESLAARLGDCGMFLGHDSGVSHLAAACGAPCVLLFGPTDPAMWAPPTPHVRVIRRGETMDAIPVDAVRAEIRLIARR